MSGAPHTYIEPLTPDEVDEARLRILETGDHGLLRAFKAGGIRTTHRGGSYIALVDECFCAEPQRVDSEAPDRDRPRIRKQSLFCPMHEHSMSVREALDRFMKTKAAKRKFLEKAQPILPEPPTFYAVEAGEGKATRLAVSADLQEAIAKVAPADGETFRAVVLRCRDEELAVELAEKKRDALPWCEGLELGPDGNLPADWHGGRLTAQEALLLKRQTDQDRRAKRLRREKLIREMERQPL